MSSNVDQPNTDLSYPVDPSMFVGVDGQDVETMVRQRLVESLDELEFKIDAMMDSLGEAEKNKLKKLREHLKEYRAHMEKIAKSQKLGNVLKALGILGFLIALVAAIFVPNPLTISMLIVTTIMMFEPMIAESLGKQSMMETMMQEIFQAFRGTLGDVGAAIAAALILFAVFIVISAGSASGITVLGRTAAQAANIATKGTQAGAQATVQTSANVASSTGGFFGRALPQFGQFSKFVQNMGSQLKEAFSSWGRLKEVLNIKIKTTPKQDAAINKFLNTVQFAITMAMGGVQFEFTTVRYEGAQHLHDAEVALALQEFWNSITDMINSDVNVTYNEFENAFSSWRQL